MRKIFLTVSLSLALTISCFGGVTPISGFAGCENGLYYPDTGECVVGLAQQSNSNGKQYPAFSETALIRAILSVRDIVF